MILPVVHRWGCEILRRQDSENSSGIALGSLLQLVEGPITFFQVVQKFLTLVLLITSKRTSQTQVVHIPLVLSCPIGVLFLDPMLIQDPSLSLLLFLVLMVKTNVQDQVSKRLLTIGTFPQCSHLYEICLQSVHIQVFPL